MSDDFEAEVFAFLCRKYVQRADPRQKSMGLQYTEAETHDLAKEVARFALALLAPADRGETQAVGDGWSTDMEAAPKDGTRILVEFDRSVGVHAVAWEESASGSTGWCVDDNKHGPYALRGYMNELRWRPLPKPPSPDQNRGEPDQGGAITEAGR